ncbi:MAG: hypothetical protein A2Z77_06600 [Chloroflexi bacterium RBG_13_51_36]|nr:MAG: hypothetical protein A2Z77_06600 [Chloroflexi bacterium RBG_13_51_36]
MRKIIIILVLVVTLLALGTGAAYAAQGSLPGETLYPVKLGTEQVRMLLPGDDVAKTERALDSADERVREMEALAEKGRSQDLDLAVEKYGYAMNMTVAAMERACNKGLDTENVTAMVAEAMAAHLPILDTLYDMVPEEAKAAIGHAMETSEMGREDALVALARYGTVQAAEMNLAAMEGRLNRIRARVHDPESLQIALQQFDDMAGFIKEICQIAEEAGVNVAEVAELVTEASSRHLEVLAELYEEVPDEAKEAVRSAMEASYRGYEETTMALMRSGVGESDLPAIPESIRHRMEDILGWTDAPKARIPTGGSSGWSCPSCRY